MCAPAAATVVVCCFQEGTEGAEGGPGGRIPAGPGNDTDVDGYDDCFGSAGEEPVVGGVGTREALLPFDLVHDETGVFRGRSVGATKPATPGVLITGGEGNGNFAAVRGANDESGAVRTVFKAVGGAVVLLATGGGQFFNQGGVDVTEDDVHEDNGFCKFDADADLVNTGGADPTGLLGDISGVIDEDCLL